MATGPSLSQADSILHFMNLTDTDLPSRSGISLKSVHYSEILNGMPDVGWFEVHPENYMGNGGLQHKYLTAIRDHYPLSMHGVGMSLGSSDGIDQNHLDALAGLVNRYQPQQVSEHLSWSQFNGIFLNDLLPLPYHAESLKTLSRNIDRVQEALGRKILIENPSAYIEFHENSWSEPEFLRELVSRTGCGLLLDVNNIFVSACNQGFDPYQYLESIPFDEIGEIHLSGHTLQKVGDTEIRIDDHGSAVKEPVWKLFEHTLIKLKGPCPVLIEWDTDIPDLKILLEEAVRSDKILNDQFKSTDNSAAA
jgi:uncharacterized protein (UPF0276 family)